MVELNIYEIIMQVVNFLILLYFLNKLLFKKLQVFLDQRQNEIESNLQTAEQQKLDTQKILEKQNHLLRESRQQALQIKEEAENIAKKNSAQILNEAKDKSQQILQDNENQLLHQSNKIKDELTDYLATVSSKIVKKVLSSQTDQKLLDEEIKKEIKAYKG